MAETFLRIPKARVGVLIGTSGKTKEQLEKEIDCKLEIDREGDAEISSDDPLALIKAKNIVTAIGRGFSPENALMLLDESYLLDVINLQDVLGKSEKALARYKSRIIGTEGKSKKKIEETTDTTIAVYGKTVSIIGQRTGMQNAKHAISMILQGATHNAVFIALGRRSKKRSADG